MLNHLSEDFKKIILAGIGAIALSAKKSKDLIDDLVEKGELTVEQGKILNEELKHEIKTKVCPFADASLEKMTPEELKAMKDKIDALLSKDEMNGTK